MKIQTNIIGESQIRLMIGIETLGESRVDNFNVYTDCLHSFLIMF